MQKNLYYSRNGTIIKDSRRIKNLTNTLDNTCPSEEQAGQVFTLYFTMHPTDDEKTMTLKTFTGFLVDTVLPDKTYGAAISEETAASIRRLDSMIDLALSGTQYGIGQMASVSGMSEETVTRVYALRFYDAGKKMSAQEFVNYILDNGYASGLGESTASTLKMLRTVMQDSTSGKKYDYKAAASLFGMDKSTMKLLYTYKRSGHESWKLSVQKLLNYIVENEKTFAETMSKDTLSGVKKLHKIVNASINNTRFSPSEIADLIGIDAYTVNKLYLLNISRNGDVSDWKMSFQGFVTYLSENILTNEDIAERLDTENTDKIESARTLVDAVVSGDKYTPKELYGLIHDFSEELNESKLELIYLYHDSQMYSDPDWKLNVLTMVDYLADDIFNDSRFTEFLDEDRKATITDTRETLYDAVESLKGEHYSRVLLRVKGLTNMGSINEFFDGINADLNGSMQGEYHFIGDSAMSYEMSKTFGRELTFITLLTAAAIFLVVALTFRNLALPSILVLIVQCGVYIAVSVIGLQGMSLYYLTLLMVECILMGSTIDYGILFSTYYRDCREYMNVKEALTAAYRGSIETIMTSGSILVIVTGVLSGYFPDPSTAQICRNISIGAFSASMLILFILPGVLAALDRLVKKKHNNEN